MALKMLVMTVVMSFCSVCLQLSPTRAVCAEIVRLASEREREMEPKYQWISRRRLQNRVVRCSLKRKREGGKEKKKKKEEEA